MKIVILLPFSHKTYQYLNASTSINSINFPAFFPFILDHAIYCSTLLHWSDACISILYIHINFIFKALELDDALPFYPRIYPEDKTFHTACSCICEMLFFCSLRTYSLVYMHLPYIVHTPFMFIKSNQIKYQHTENIQLIFFCHR